MCVHRLRPSKEGGGMVLPNPGTKNSGPHCKSVHQSLLPHFWLKKQRKKSVEGWGGGDDVRKDVC